MILIKEGGVLPTHTNWVEIQNCFHKYTSKAGLLDTGYGKKWIPLSQLVAKVTPKGVKLYIPEWLYDRVYGTNKHA